MNLMLFTVTNGKIRWIRDICVRDPLEKLVR